MKLIETVFVYYFCYVDKINVGFFGLNAHYLKEKCYVKYGILVSTLVKFSLVNCL
jgi:hypothetical protein